MILGITGGVGTGKSKVLSFLEEEYNAFVIEADKVGHEVTLPGNPAYNSLLELFGEEILLENKEIDRIKLGEKVFSDSEIRKIVSGIIHPCVRKEIDNQIKNIQKESENSIIVIEAALLIEAGYKDICDVMWYIYTDIETRKKRLKQQRNYSEKKIMDIVSGQLSEEDFKAGSDYVIDNSGDFEKTKKQIYDILGSGGVYGRL